MTYFTCPHCGKWIKKKGKEYFAVEGTPNSPKAVAFTRRWFDRKKKILLPGA